MMKSRRLILAVAGLIAIALAFWAFDLPARFGWVHRRVTEMTLYGNIDIRQVELGFRVGGRVAEMRVDEGDTVRAGTVLARLDAEPAREHWQAAEANAAALSASLKKLEAGPRPAEIAQARAQQAEAEATLRNAGLAFARARSLQIEGVVSRASFDQAQASKDTALARTAAAGQALRLLEEGYRREDIDIARANLQQAQADLATAQTALQDTVLVSPADGVILSRVREPGAIVASADPVYLLSLTRPVWVRAYVSETDLGRLYPGMKVEVSSDAAPDRPHEGSIGFISPVAEFTPKSVETPDLRTDLVYRLRIIVKDPDPGLRQGMPVTVHIALPGGS